ncbi:MAG TPA: iron ABC transporter permease [Alphaproteobacteria bacterium]|jgi:iron(III) transport system permease protein
MTLALPEFYRARFALPKIRGTAIWHHAVLLVVLLMVLTPVLFLVLGSFSKARMPSEFSLWTLTLDNYVKVWSDRGTYGVFANTLWFATGSTAVGLACATVLAWLVERTNLPFKVWVYAGVPMTLAMPGMLQAMAWVLLASPRIGFFNKILMTSFGLESPPFNVYSLSGMVVIEGLRMVPTAFLMLVPLLRSMDPSLEEAAAMSGAKPVSMLRKVTLRLMAPGLVAVGIYQFTSALEGFEVPGILGLPSGIFVFSTKIYNALHSASSLPAYGDANALGVVYLVVAIAATYLYSRVISRSERYTIITGKGYRPKVIDLGAWRWPAFAFVVLFLAVSIVIPFLVLAYVSFLPFLQVPSAKALATFSWTNYLKIFSNESLGVILWNTVIVTLATAAGTIVVSFLVSLVVVRSKFWGRKLLDQFAFIPHSIPGMVMGLALLWVFLQADKAGMSLFGSLWSIVIAFVIGYMSYGTRAMNSAIMQIHKDLEEAAQVSGARQWRVMLRVFCPLLMPALVGILIWTVLHVVRAAGLPLMLAEGQDNTVLAAAIWNMWDDGLIGPVGAIGTMMMLVLLVLTLALRVFGFGRGVQMQDASKP